MPLDFRYHLASLTAVFAALLLGILVGVAMKEGTAFQSQVQQLRKEFRRSEALRDLDARVDHYNQRTQPLLLHARMVGRNVALITQGVAFPAEDVGPVRDALKEAGAAVVVEITLKPALTRSTPEQLAVLYRRLGRAIPNQPAADALLAALAAELGAPETPTADLLVAEQLISLSGDIHQPISSVVLLGGMSKDAMEALAHVDLPLLRGCVARKLRVAAVERLAAPFSAIFAYRKAAPITVDNVDRAVGRIALVHALAADQHGNYGYKPTADDVSPEIQDMMPGGE
jgi:hypothetical protein